MDFILNNWASILSIISFILSCFALYFNWQNTNINKEKFKNEQDDKKKATIVWEEIEGSRSLIGYKTIKISNTGQSDAKSFQIIINDKELEKVQDSDFDTEDDHPTGYSFDGLKIVNKINNSVPTEITAGFSASFRVITSPINHDFITVKLIWDDEFEEKRERIFKYTPGNSKLAN
ncbi:hypothetical protein [Bacillus cereus]